MPSHVGTPLMRAKLILFVLFWPLLSGSCGCAPSELFSGIDRHCFLADWTNHHSCLSCCCCKSGSCRRPAPVIHPMLELGDPAKIGVPIE